VQSLLLLPCRTVTKFKFNIAKAFAANFRLWLWRTLTPRYRIPCPISVAYVVAKNHFETEAVFKIEMASLRSLSPNSETDGLCFVGCVCLLSTFVAALQDRILTASPEKIMM
jgi:hypothetical protein